ncbi:MAG TPA: hypothetical protein VMY36_00900 [Patescibacteria group bacterium]|nr:hypothetical protein [Patescibacteria group bacterium]
MPEKWAEFHKEKLLEASGGCPIITISRKPLDWGKNLIQTEYGVVNLFEQKLRGAKLAKTPYIAIADDDTLYPEQHFQFRPNKEGFFYNLNRWHLFTWGRSYYFHKPRCGGGLMIATRNAIIKAIENRLQNLDKMRHGLHGELGDKRVMLKYDLIKAETFYTKAPVVSFYHQKSMDKLNQRRRKYPWPVRAYDIPIWGKAKNLRRKFV